MAKFLSPPPIGTPANEGAHFSHSWEMWFQDLWAKIGTFGGKVTAVASRVLQAGAGISIVNGDGVAGDPVISSTITQYTDAQARAAVGPVVAAETDPVFGASPAGGITQTNINQWNAAAPAAHGVTLGTLPVAKSATGWKDSWLSQDTYGLEFSGPIFNIGTATDSDLDVFINSYGYNGGTTRFRNLAIADGKSGTIGLFDGANGRLFIPSSKKIGFGSSRTVPLLLIYSNGTDGYIESVTGVRIDIKSLDSDIDIHTGESGDIHCHVAGTANKIQLESAMGLVEIDNIADAGADTDKFLCLTSGSMLKYRTGAELFADININVALALTDATTITVDASGSRFIDATLTLTGNHKLGNPSGMFADGQMLMLRVTNTGAYNLTYDTAYEFANGLAEPTITPGNGKVSYLGWKYYATTGKWKYIAEALADA